MVEKRGTESGRTKGENGREEIGGRGEVGIDDEEDEMMTRKARKRKWDEVEEEGH